MGVSYYILLFLCLDWIPQGSYSFCRPFLVVCRIRSTCFWNHNNEFGLTEDGDFAMFGINVAKEDTSNRYDVDNPLDQKLLGSLSLQQQQPQEQPQEQPQPQQLESPNEIMDAVSLYESVVESSQPLRTPPPELPQPQSQQSQQQSQYLSQYYTKSPVRRYDDFDSLYNIVLTSGQSNHQFRSPSSPTPPSSSTVDIRRRPGLRPIEKQSPLRPPQQQVPPPLPKDATLPNQNYMIQQQLLQEEEEEEMQARARAQAQAQARAQTQAQAQAKQEEKRTDSSSTTTTTTTTHETLDTEQLEYIKEYIQEQLPSTAKDKQRIHDYAIEFMKLGYDPECITQGELRFSDLQFITTFSHKLPFFQNQLQILKTYLTTAMPTLTETVISQYALQLLTIDFQPPNNNNQNHRPTVHGRALQKEDFKFMKVLHSRYFWKYVHS